MIILKIASLLFYIQTQATVEDLTYRPNRTYTGQTIWNLPEIPESEVDIGLWALLIAKEVNPELEIEPYLKQLDELAAAVVKGLPNQDEDMAKLMITQIVLYQPGFWNENKTYAYDLDDPLGNKGNNKLLSTYMDTRKGNCVSMPTLYWAVLERVDANLPIYGSQAPFHLFIRMKDRQKGNLVNMETTNGHTARTEWLISQSGATEKQIESGLYFQNMSKKQFLSILITDLENKAVKKGDLAMAWKYNQLILQLDPHSVHARVNRGAIHHMKAKSIVDEAKSANRPLTPGEKTEIKQLGEKGNREFEFARSKGWEPLEDKHLKAYLERIQSAKETN